MIVTRKVGRVEGNMHCTRPNTALREYRAQSRNLVVHHIPYQAKEVRLQGFYAPRFLVKLSPFFFRRPGAFFFFLSLLALKQAASVFMSYPCSCYPCLLGKFLDRGAQKKRTRIQWSVTVGYGLCQKPDITLVSGYRSRLPG